MYLYLSLNNFSKQYLKYILNTSYINAFVLLLKFNFESIFYETGIYSIVNIMYYVLINQVNVINYYSLYKIGYFYTLFLYILCFDIYKLSSL